MKATNNLSGCTSEVCLYSATYIVCLAIICFIRVFTCTKQCILIKIFVRLVSI